ncbi:MAG: ferrous iron transport protein A [Clostridia bacterium]|nr:ferrous iron transport protein A [Clostridia bacterium]
MNICDLKKGERALIMRVTCPKEMKERLKSLGIYISAEIVLLKISLFKSTYLIEAGGAKIAIGRGAAEGVQVWKK